MKTEKVFLEKINVTIHYLIGKNAHDNFAVIDEALENDIWIHATKFSSCHVVALLPDSPKIFTDYEIKEIARKGAELCKFHTKKLNDINNISFIYTEIKNVTKTKTQGLVYTVNTKTLIV